MASKKKTPTELELQQLRRRVVYEALAITVKNSATALIESEDLSSAVRVTFSERIAAAAGIMYELDLAGDDPVRL